MTAAKPARVHTLTIAQAAALAGVSVRLMHQCVSVRRNGCAELQAAVTSGLVSVRLAVEILKFDQASQALIVGALPDVPKKHRAGVVEMLLADWKRQQGGLNHAE